MCIAKAHPCNRQHLGNMLLWLLIIINQQTQNTGNCQVKVPHQSVVTVTGGYMKSIATLISVQLTEELKPYHITVRDQPRHAL